MTSTQTGSLVLVLLAVALLAAACGWSRRLRPAAAPVSLVLLAAALVAAAPGHVPSSEEATTVLAVGLAGLLGVIGGGPLTAWVFAFVDRHDTPGRPSMHDAARVLRGGAWIGALERTAILASLLAGWPEGVALSLALKGLGRYPELRNQENPGTAERFIIGTFTSVLWAAGCAGVVLLVR